MRITKLSISALLALSFVACRGNSNTSPDANGPGDSGGSNDAGGPVRIQDVQSDAMAVGTKVELRGVIVTAFDTFGGRARQDLWVQEPGGGPFSGVRVFFRTALPSTMEFAIGDIVDITGAVKSEFRLNGAEGSITEVQAPSGGTITVTKTGTGAPPVPTVVDMLSIGVKSEAERNAEWEKWEGVLVTSSNVVAFGSPRCILSRGACNDPTRTNLAVTGVAVLESNLAAFPTPEIASGDCLATVTGIVDYAFDYIVLPRATGEVMKGGTGCVFELASGATNLCTDGADNDGNSFSDCADFGCQIGPGAWLGAACAPTDATCGCSANLTAGMSVSKVNTGTAGAVLLNDVFVTAVGPRGFWIADALQAAQNGGVFVFTSAAPDTSIVVGKKLATVQGLAGSFGANAQKTIQISTPTAGALSDGGEPLPIEGATAAAVSAIAGGAPFAGSLVKLANLKVTAVDAATKRTTLTDNNNVTITMDDGAFPDYTDAFPTVGTCYATLVGVMDLLTDEQVRTINPRSTADLVATGGTCN